jgi:hypothetical protein
MTVNLRFQSLRVSRQDAYGCSRIGNLTPTCSATGGLEAADQLAVLRRHPAALDAAAVVIREAGGNMHVVLDQKRHAGKGSAR